MLKAFKYAVKNTVDWKKNGVHILFLLCVAGLAFFVVPLGLSFAVILERWPLVGLAVSLGGLGSGWLVARFCPLPQGFWVRYWLPLLSFFVSASLLARGLAVSGGNLHSDALYYPVFVSPGFILAVLLESFSGVNNTGSFLPALYALAYCAGFMAREGRGRPWRAPRLVLWSGGLLLCLVALAGARFAHQRDLAYLPRSHGFQYAGGYSSVDLTPYSLGNPENILPVLSLPSSFQLENPEKLPVLDGAEAAYPVYAAFAKACYPSEPQTEKAVTFTNTINAFRRLIHGGVDIFFGAQPSKRQSEEARDLGVELVLTPIGREAFVFFVGKDNPVTSLTPAQLRDVYSGKITNWKELGGGDLRIRAFQRPEDSGSQTVMRLFMGATPLAAPLRENVVGPMGGVVEKTADYRNMPGAVGYSFRFFLTSMGRNANVRPLALDGVEPSPENLRDGTYPYIIPLYAVTLKNNRKPEVRAFLDWMRGPQGRDLVEKVGYAAP